MTERLILFAKRPIAGGVKTRLVPPLTPDQALRLYEAFLDDQVAFLDSMREPYRAVELCTDGPWKPPAAYLERLRSTSTTEQGAGDLGERMLRALRRSWGADRGLTIIIGCDAPTLPRGHVLAAFRALREGAEMVVSPADDGGYVLIGSREPSSTVFREIPWGGPRVMEVTRLRAVEAGVRLDVVEPWYDVDDGTGLDRLGEEVATAAGRCRAPATARYLRVLRSSLRRSPRG